MRILGMLVVGLLVATKAMAFQVANQPVAASTQTYKVMALPNTEGPPTTATNDWVLLNGSTLQGSTRNLDAAPRTLSLSGYSAWAQATVNTSGADVVLGAGLGKRSIALTRANCATDTVTVVRNLTSTALIEGTDWNRGASDSTAATSLAAAINALSGVTADSSGGTVRVQKDPNDNTMGPAALITITTDDVTCAAITNGTDGTLRLLGTVSVPTLTVTGITGSNGGTISNATNNAWTFAENSEDLIETYTSNTVTATSSTGVNSYVYSGINVTVPGLVYTTLTGANGGTIANPANAFTLTANSEDYTSTMTSNTVTNTSSTGVTSEAWVGIGLTTNTTITSSAATNIGWSTKSGANTACETTCTFACVQGYDSDSSNLPVACDSAAADVCLCAGAN